MKITKYLPVLLIFCTTATAENWLLENKSVGFDTAFEDGKLQLTSLKNIKNGRNYIADSDALPLFTYIIDGKTVSANDGKWELLSADTRKIKRFKQTWGDCLTLKLRRTKEPAIEITTFFELYDDDAGIRFYTKIKNLSPDKKLRVSESTMFATTVSGGKRTLYFGTEGIDWGSDPKTHRGKINCIVHYDSNDGWFIAPENSHCTSIEPGAFKGDPKNPLLFHEVTFPDNSKPGKCIVETNPKAIQLVLFPEEEIEYFSVNLGIFNGDLWDARFAATQHLRERFKFMNPTRLITSNDWYWRKKRQEKIIREDVVPILTKAGFDMLLIDHWWYPDPDGTEVRTNFTVNLPELAKWVEEQGLHIGYWFSLHGSSKWGRGRDLADPANIDFKIKQTDEILVSKYRSRWQQIDLGELWKTDEVTEHSHPSDSVYRKWLGFKRFCRVINDKHPELLIQETCEFENPPRKNQSSSLLGIPENGISGLFWRGKNPGACDLFHYFGIYPSEAMFSFWSSKDKHAPECPESPDSMNMIYQFLTARHQSLYLFPPEWSEKGVELCGLFNEWRKTPEIESLLNEPIRPTYSGGTWSEPTFPYVWMFLNEDKTDGLVIAVGDPESAENFSAPLRWVNPEKTYTITDISLDDNVKFTNKKLGTKSGAELKKDFKIALKNTISKTRAYRLRAEIGPDR